MARPRKDGNKNLPETFTQNLINELEKLTTNTKTLEAKAEIEWFGIHSVPIENQPFQMLWH